MMDVIHVITPGDHYSPRTGSAIPTVVHGLATASAAEMSKPRVRHSVVLDASTYSDRYDSATAIEYVGVRGPDRRARYADILRGRLALPRRATAAYYRPAVDSIMNRPPSLVLAHNAPVVPWMLRDSPHRVVLYAHNDLLRTYTRREAGRMLAGVAAIICVSDSLAERTRHAIPTYLAERVQVVGNGVDCAQFTPASGAAHEGEASGAPLRVMFVGRMVREKGADVLVRAAAALRSEDVEFVIVGSVGFDRNAALSPFEQGLRELAAETPARIRFEPFVDRPALPALLRSADILVVPSRWAEPSGLTAGEGLATGLPIIASRIGGVPEVVGPAGRYVEPDDSDALAAALADLARNPELRRRMGAQAREWALAHDWSWAWSNLRGILETL